MSEEEGLITEAMVKKATYLIHKLADQRNETFETIRSKCKKMFGYMNLAKLSLEDGHAMISKLIEVTGGEEKARLATDDDLISQQGARDTDDQSKPKEIIVEPAEKKKIKTEDDLVTATMRKAIRAAVDITLKEVVEKDVPVQGLGGFVLEIGKVIFEAKMSEEASE
jgi:predicted metalloprotease with PDZ domain